VRAVRAVAAMRAVRAVAAMRAVRAVAAVRAVRAMLGRDHAAVGRERGRLIGALQRFCAHLRLKTRQHATGPALERRKLTFAVPA